MSLPAFLERIAALPAFTRLTAVLPERSGAVCAAGLPGSSDALLVAALGGTVGHSPVEQTAATDLRISAAAESGDPHDAARQLRRRAAADLEPRRGAAALLAALEAADAVGAPALPADLAIGGVELMSALGGSPGPWLQPLLETLLREAARGAEIGRAHV